MNILAVGLNHKSSPLAVRERLALNTEQVGNLLGHLKGRFAQAEFVVISTCNRVELYRAARGHAGPESNELVQCMGDYCGVGTGDFADYLYVYRNEEAVRHLLEVASSLDSLVVGEAQIIGQVKESYRLACAACATGKVLNRLFHCAFATSKEIYTTTSIAQRRVSVAGVAVQLARDIFPEISQAKVAVIGTGQMGELLIRHLLEAGCKDISVTSRSCFHSQSVAERYNLKADSWDRLEAQMSAADLVIAATMAEEHLFDKASWAKIMAARNGRELLLLDIAVPRNFDPAINELPGVELYCIDDLSAVARENAKARHEDVAQAQQIIADNVASFMDWFVLMDIGPLVGRLRKKFQRMSDDEFERHFGSEGRIAPAARAKMEAMVRRIVNKAVHELIAGLHRIAQQQGSDVAAKLIEDMLNEDRR